MSLAEIGFGKSAFFLIIMWRHRDHVVLMTTWQKRVIASDVNEKENDKQN